MAKELHITIDTFIGTQEKEDGKQEVGYMDFMLEGALHANPGAKDLVVHLSCPGGCTYQGNKLYNKFADFRDTEGNTVTMINEDMAASMATILMQAATPGRRYSRPLAPFMVHKPLFPQLDWVNADDLKKAITQLDMLEASFANIYAKATGRTSEEIHADMREAMFITAEEAKKRGYIDEILESSSAFKPKEREAKAVAFFNPPKELQINQLINNDANMSTEKAPSPWAKVKAAMTAAVAALSEAENAPETPVAEIPTPVAATETLENGKTIYFEGELAEGVMVYSDAEMTALVSDGEHVLADGRTITVASGAVTAISEPEPANNASEELAAAQAKIEELEGKLAGIQNSIVEKDKTIKGLQAFNRKTTVVKPAQAFAGDGEKQVDPLVSTFSKAFKKK